MSYANGISYNKVSTRGRGRVGVVVVAGASIFSIHFFLVVSLLAVGELPSEGKDHACAPCAELLGLRPPPVRCPHQWACADLRGGDQKTVENPPGCGGMMTCRWLPELCLY